MSDHPVIIVGAGISGLSAAHALHRRGIEFVLLEMSDRVGGVIRTFKVEDFLCEAGPNTIHVTKPEVLDFLQDAGLLEEAVDASPGSKKRFVLQDGVLKALPMSLGSFIRSDILGGASKLGLLKELWRKRGDDSMESIDSFFRRRLGAEVMEELVGPFISGVYAGDPEKLLVRHSFPGLYEWEQRYGGLIRGMICAPKPARKIAKRLISWEGGLEEMVTCLADGFRDRIHLSCRIEKVSKIESGFLLRTGRGEWSASRLIVATSSPAASHLLRGMAEEATLLETVPHAPIAVVHLGFDWKDVGHPLDGFGVLISRRCGLRTLGSLFSSSLFSKRAPDGRVLLTVFLGGRTDPSVLNFEDASLVKLALEELKEPLQIMGAPVFSHVLKWSRAIPQYEEEHDRILECCGSLERRLPGLKLLGSYRGGVSLQDCMMNGFQLGGRL